MAPAGVITLASHQIASFSCPYLPRYLTVRLHVGAGLDLAGVAVDPVAVQVALPRSGLPTAASRLPRLVLPAAVVGRSSVASR